MTDEMKPNDIVEEETIDMDEVNKTEDTDIDEDADEEPASDVEDTE